MFNVTQGILISIKFEKNTFSVFETQHEKRQKYFSIKNLIRNSSNDFRIFISYNLHYVPTASTGLQQHHQQQNKINFIKSHFTLQTSIKLNKSLTHISNMIWVKQLVFMNHFEYFRDRDFTAALVLLSNLQPKTMPHQNTDAQNANFSHEIL